MNFPGRDPVGRDSQNSSGSGDSAFRPERPPEADTPRDLGGMPDVLAPNPFTIDPRSGSRSGPTPPDKCENVLASGARWDGTLTVDSSVRIDGVFSGQIISNSTVHVAEGAQVDAKIQAAFIAISGNFRGELHCEQRTDLLPRGRVRGDVITKVLVVQEGAVFDGHVQMTASATERLRSRPEDTAPVDAPATEPRRDRRPAPMPPTPNDGEV